MSSAGNTRGLIEAAGVPVRIHRGAVSLPRGIPAASLKPGFDQLDVPPLVGVFRGEYPRPH